MNMMKKNGGFTLVELIVVIAILAILAGVAVPAYTGYLDKAKQAADITVCDAVKTAVFAAYAEEGADMPAAIVVADGDVKVGDNTTDADTLDGDYLTNFNVYYGGGMTSVAIDNTKAEWTSGGDWVITK